MKTLKEMTICPITHQEMITPYLGNDHQSYEKDAISQWLEKNQRSPITRAPMEMHCLMPDYSMSRLISTMKEFAISISDIENIDSLEISGPEERSTAIKPSPTPEDLSTTKPMSSPEDMLPESIEEDVNKKGQKRKRKAARLKTNQSAKKQVLRILRRHVSYLEDMNMFNKENFHPSMPTTPSYSIMHSLEDGFSVLMYSGSHRVRLNPNICLHKYNAVRIILPEWMAIIWHESLFHAGTRSRNTEDMRFFSYVWPHLPSNTTRRTRGTMDGVAREPGDHLYRNNINSKVCDDMYRELPRCLHCQKLEEILDLRSIPSTSYAPGERIIGCLDTLGWTVVRGVRTSRDTYQAVKEIAKQGVRGRPTKKGTWVSIENRSNNRKMKYKPTCNPKVEWVKNELCCKFLEDIETKVLGNVWRNTPLKDIKYCLGKFNLLKNDGFIGLDQQAHTDYAPRLAM